MRSKDSPSPKSPKLRLLSFGAMLCAPLFLAACGSPAAVEPDDSTPSPSDSAASDDGGAGEGAEVATTAAGVATLDVEGVSFTFDLGFCAIGDDDVLAHGPSADVSGQPAYLDVDFTKLDDVLYGEARVDLGTTEQFSSSDDFYVFSTERGGEHLIEHDSVMSMIDIVGPFFLGGEGQALDGVLELDCS